MLYFKRIILIGSEEVQVKAIWRYLDNNYFVPIIQYNWRERKQIESALNAEDARNVLFIVVQKSPVDDLQDFERLHLSSTLFVCRDVADVDALKDWIYIPPFRERALVFHMAALNIAILKLDSERMLGSYGYKSLL